MSMHYIFLFAKTYNNYDYWYKITVKIELETQQRMEFADT